MGTIHLASVTPRPFFQHTYSHIHTHTYAHTHTCTHAKSIHISQECISVGSIPSAAVAVLGEGLPGEGVCLGVVCLGGVSAQGGYPPG